MRNYTSREQAATCLQCGEGFTYVRHTGTLRKHCSDACRVKHRVALGKNKPPCVVDGCKNISYYSDGSCNPCYIRKRKTGSFAKKRHVHRTVSSNGYVVALGRAGHPLANINGRVYEHRMVLFDAIGSGPHSCHWCGAPIEWVKGKCAKGALVVDHLDGVKTNNATGNLVPACNGCNATRGLFMAWVMRHKDDPFLWRMYQKALAA